jgi:Na+/melibiose symporter-like transporter
MALLGMFCVITIPAIVELYDTSLSAKVSAIGIFVLIAIPIITLNGLYQVPDAKSAKVVAKIKNPLKTFKSLFGNTMLNKIVLAAGLIGFCMSLNGALYLIWMDVVMELPEYSSRLMLMYYLVSVVGLGLWRYLSIKTSKHFAAGVACFYAIIILLIGFVGFFIIRDLDTEIKLIAVGSFIILYGFSFSGPMPLINAIIADISDKLSVDNNENISGTVFSYLTTITKVGFGLAAVIPYLVLELIWGFDIKLGVENTESSKMAIFYIYTFVPIVCYTIASYMLFSHSLGRDEHEKIKSAIEEGL